ncbi:MAG: urease accessory protein UreD [Rhizobiaceae bacterium]
MDALAEQHSEVRAPLQRSRGTGRLSVTSTGGRTRIADLFQEGCAKLRIPAARERRPLEAVMINTAGGMTGGDRIGWAFEAGRDSTLTITTQTCERVYRSAGGVAETDVTLKAGAGAKLAWLPQETILFDESRFRRRIDADLDASAELLLVEAVIFGRRLMGEAVANGDFRDSWRIRQDGRLVHAEAFALAGEIDALLARPAIGDGAGAMATVLYISPTAEHRLDEARKLIGTHGGASFWNGKLLARLTARDGYRLRGCLIPLMTLLNPAATLPKAWAH